MMSRQGKQRNAAPSNGPVTAHLHLSRASTLRADSSTTAPGSTVNFCSWRRLVDVLREAGQVMPSEEVCSFIVEDGGLTISMRTR